LISLVGDFGEECAQEGGQRKAIDNALALAVVGRPSAGCSLCRCTGGNHNDLASYHLLYASGPICCAAAEERRSVISAANRGAIVS
jgi:hypothetical protein